MDAHYVERAAARWWNYTLREWMEESPELKAQAIADWLEHNRREAYEGERAREHARKNHGKETEEPMTVGAAFAGFRRR